jgi:hypothetical protein
VPSPVFDAFAVKVTLVPSQIVEFGLTAKFTEGVITVELTRIFKAFDNAVVVAKQVVPPLIVIVQFTTSASASVVLVKVFDVLF